MKIQIDLVTTRDGSAAALEYAERVLAAYRGAARYKNKENPRMKHFAHLMPFRPHFVTSIIYLRNYIRTHTTKEIS